MATAPKGSGPASDKIMTASEMKPLLALSKKEPVNVAVGLTSDGEGLMLMHKLMKPKKVLATLRAEAGKAKLQLNTSSLRFGRAEVDPDYDASMVRLFLNKEAPGAMRAKLVEVVKQAAYQKVEMNVDASLEEEPEDETQGSEQTASTTDSAPPPAPPAPPPAPPGPPPVDMSGVHNELAALIPKIAGAAAGDPAKLDTMKQLATKASVAIKATNLPDATSAINELKQVISGGAPAQPTAAAAPSGDSAAPTKVSFVAMQKSRLAWDAARKKVASEINAFKDAVAAEMEGDADEVAIMDALDELDEILEVMNEDLIDTLDEMLNEGADGENYADLMARAKQQLASYAKYAESNEIVKQLQGATPVGVTLSISSTLTGTVKALQSTLR